MNPLTADDLLTALELVAARVPDRHVTPDLGMARAWWADLRVYDRVVVQEAARSWSGMRFPSVTEFGDHVKEVQRRVSDAERRARPAVSEGCPVCGKVGGGGMFEAMDFDERDEPQPRSHHGDCRPCHACNPKAYERWKGGHMLPGHDCQECRDIRRSVPARERQ